jgi:hypothetical protein
MSIGLGRQSKAMFAMACLGRHNVPKPSVAIFADTGDEIADTYRELEWAKVYGAEHGIRVEVVSVGISLAAAAAAVSGRKRKNGAKFFVSLPLFVVNADGSKGMIRRQCTNEFKLEPIRKRVRELLGLAPRERAHGKLARALIGISLDEAAMRMKGSKDAYIENHYPLVDAGLNVNDCIRFLKEVGLSVPVKSACRMCPYHDNTYWRWLKKERSEEFEKACEFDDMIRDLTKAGLTQPAYVHTSCIPLRLVDFSTDVDRGQKTLAGGFGNDCEGMCGV